MKKISFIIIIITFSILHCIANTEIGYNKNVDYEQLFNNEILEGDYDSAWDYLNYIKYKDSLSWVTIEHIANCYIHHNKYQEGINYLNFIRITYPQYKLIIYCNLGNLYYLLNKNKEALEYLTPSIEEMEKLYNPTIMIAEEANISYTLMYRRYYLGIYANCLYAEHKYDNAELYYNKFFDAVAVENDISTKEIFKIKNMGYYLYNCAYNYILQGKESSGLEYLSLAAESGYDEAIQDYLILKRSSTFNTEIQYSKKELKQFNKFIDKYNIYNSFQIPSKDVAYSFWMYIKNNNKKYQEFLSQYNKKPRPGIIYDAIGKVVETKDELDLLLEFYAPYKKGELESKLEKITCGTKIEDLRIYSAPEPNAFATPFGHIYITDALLDLYHYNMDLMVAICAHELAHYICNHTLIASWEQLKKERRNEIWAAVTATMNSVGSGLLSMHDTPENNEKRIQQTVIQNNNIFESFRENAYYFRFKYSREQEIEADILAYKFCEVIGIGGHAYITALELIGDGKGYLKTYDKESTHPTNAFRIGLLRYLHAKEHGLIIE